MPLPSPGDLLNPGIKHRSPILQADSLPSEPPIGPVLTSSTGQFHLRNSLHFLSPIHFPDLILCPPYSHNTFPTGVFIICSAQGNQDPRFLQLPLRENPHPSAGNTGLYLNMVSDYFIRHQFLHVCTPMHSHTHTQESYYLS